MTANSSKYTLNQLVNFFSTTRRFNPLLNHGSLCFIIFHYILLYFIMFYYTSLCFIIFHYVLLYFIMF